MDDSQYWQDDDIDADVLPDEIDFNQIIEALLDENNPFTPRYLYRLSDLEGENLHQLEETWLKVPVWRRQALMEDMQMLCEKDFLLSFEAVGRLALMDPDPKVRFNAVRTLIENECETSDLVDIYLDLMENDIDNNVRTVSTQALGQFVYLAEMGTLLAQEKRELEERLLSVAQGEDSLEVKRAALEALGFSSRDEVLTLIENALNSSNHAWQVSALIAMGRSANDFWKPQVISMLKHTNHLIRAEAARAAGELVIEEARDNLFDLVDDADEEVCTSALWALSQIGGKRVRKILQGRLNAAEEDSEISFLESALENLDFLDGLEELGLMDIKDINWDGLYAHQDEEDKLYVGDELENDETDLGDERNDLYYEDDLDEDAFDSLLK
jgi:hypothetical protein